MATKQRLVYGSSVEWGTDGVAYTALAEVRSLAVPAVEIEYLDATTLDSSGGFREYVAGLKDPGEITVEMGYTSDIYEAAIGYQAAGAPIHFKTTLPLETGQSTTGDVFEFTALVRPVMQQNAVGELIGLELALRVTGQPTFTKGS